MADTDLWDLIPDPERPVIINHDVPAQAVTPPTGIQALVAEHELLQHIQDEIDRRRLEKVEAERCKRHLLDFVRKCWHIVEEMHEFQTNWHIEELCKYLEGVTRGENPRRTIINVPPGTMKTLLVQVFWPAWEWATNPRLRYLTASYSEDRTIDANTMVRNIVTSEWYQTHFPGTVLKEDQNQKRRFDTTAGGWRIATAVRGLGTGLHPDRVLIDDPTTAEQALSDVVRPATNKWFDRTISMRGASRRCIVILIMQRLHEDDMTGHLLPRRNWEHICFPMYYETTRVDEPNWKPDPRDHRTEPGEILWPSLLPLDILEEKEIDLGPYGVAGQFQQRPAPEGGGLFKRAWFKYLDALPLTFVKAVRGWDTAGTDNAGDYTVGVKMLEFEKGFIVADVQRDQLDPDEVDSLIESIAVTDGRECAIREEKEGGASGVAVIKARTRMLQGFDYEGVTIGKDKIIRSRPYRSQCKAGNVYLLRADWNEAYLTELCGFPTASKDDQVDGSSCAFNALVGDPIPQSEGTWGSKKRREERRKWARARLGPRHQRVLESETLQ